MFLKRYFIPISLILSVPTSAIFVLHPLQSILPLIAISITFALIKFPQIWIPAIIIFTIIGELFRLPFGSANGVLVNDLFIPFIIFLWISIKIIKDRRFPETKFTKPILIFSLIAALSLIYNFSNLDSTQEMITGSFYLIRFLSYALLIPLTVDVIKNKKMENRLINLIFIAAFALCLGGFIQLILINDFSEMAIKYGWDPHIGRLLSTWFDPNLLGGFFAFILSIAIGTMLYTKDKKRLSWLILLSITLLIALFLTYSRSAYITLAFSLFILSVIKSRRLIIIASILGLLLISVSPRAQERVTNMYFSGLSLLGIGVENPDATARLRVESWRQNLQIAKENYLTGVGYNLLPYTKLNEGFVKDLSQHSAAGSDSTLLTILATTGIFGLLTYLWIILKSIKIGFLTWLDKKAPPEKRGLALGYFAGLSGLLVLHSQFVNSLLFYPLLIYVWILTGILIKKQN